MRFDFRQRMMRAAFGFWLSGALLVLPSLAWSGELPAGGRVDEQPLSVAGFMTLGAAYNDNANLGVVAATSQRRPAYHGWSAHLDTVIGLQFDWRPQADTALVVQGVARGRRF